MRILLLVFLAGCIGPDPAIVAANRAKYDAFHNRYLPVLLGAGTLTEAEKEDAKHYDIAWWREVTAMEAGGK